MDTKSMGFSLLSKGMQRQILAAQGEPVPAEEVKPQIEQPTQPEAQQAIRDAIHAERVRKYGEIDAARMRDYGLSERDL